MGRNFSISTFVFTTFTRDKRLHTIPTPRGLLCSFPSPISRTQHFVRFTSYPAIIIKIRYCTCSMARVLRFAQTQAGGACTASERAELDEYLLGSSPEGALQTLTGLQETRVGKYEYTLAVGRLYERSQYMRKRGFPPESNIFW